MTHDEFVAAYAELVQVVETTRQVCQHSPHAVRVC